MKALQGQREFFAVNLGYTSLLTGLAEMQLIFHTEALTALYFALVARSRLITHQCFGYCRAVLAQPQLCHSNIPNPVCQDGFVVLFFV